MKLEVRPVSINTDIFASVLSLISAFRLLLCYSVSLQKKLDSTQALIRVNNKFKLNK